MVNTGTSRTMNNDTNNRTITMLQVMLIIGTMMCTEGFAPSYPSAISFLRLETAVYGRKKGKLSQNVDSASMSKKRSRTKGRSTKQGKVSGGSVTISPSLAEWAASQETKDNSATMTTTTAVAISSDEDVTSNLDQKEKDTSLSYKKFRKQQPKSMSSRRDRQVKRQQMFKERQIKLNTSIEAIKSMLGLDPEKDSKEKLNIGSLLERLVEIIQIDDGIANDGKKAVKTLFQSSPPLQYGLVWAGSDEAICHVGTGLHKVPLARLEEIFISVGRQNDENSNMQRSRGWKLYEVIRILGPFPNVRNILQGEVQDIVNSDVASEIKLKYEYMIDGTGKVISAGGDMNSENDDKLREVELSIWYADEEVIICTTLMEDSFMKSAGVDGKNVVLFFRETDLEGKLETYRVA